MNVWLYSRLPASTTTTAYSGLQLTIPNQRIRCRVGVVFLNHSRLDLPACGGLMAANSFWFLTWGQAQATSPCFWSHKATHKAPGHGAIPVAPVADAVRFAGDYVDDILLHQLLEKGHIDPGTTLGKQVQASVRLGGLRRIKERLFIEHRVDVPLTHDVVVSIEESEFLSSSDIRNFETQLHNRVRTFLESTDR